MAETDHTEERARLEAECADLRRRMAALENAQRRSVEELARTHLHLYEFAGAHSLQELLTETLDAAERLTESKIGFYHFLQADQRTLSLQAWSTRTAKEFCTAAGAGAHYDVERAGVWTDCVRERAPVIHNDYASLPHRKGLPDGHAPVIRELVVPILRDGLIVAILGVGNKDTDYTQDDVRMVADLANAAWEVAQRKRAEEVMTLIVDNAPDPIFIQQNGRFVYVNRALTKLYGAETADDLLGTPSLARVAPEYHEVIAARIKAQLETRRAVPQREMEHVRLDGSRVPVETSAVAVPLREGTGHLVFLRDISERLERQRALENSERKFRNLFDNASIGMFRTRLDGSEILDINDACSTTFRTTRAEMVGRPSVIHWADPRERAELMRRLTAEPRVTDFECKMLTTTGELRYCIASLTLYQEDGIIEGSMLDITDRKRAEEKLRESEHFLRSVLETTPNLVYIYDLGEHRNLYANQEVANFLGYSAEEITTMGSALFAKILHPDDAAAVAAHHAQLASGTCPIATLEYRMRHASGEWRWLRSRDVPFSRNADGTVRSILGSTDDVTEQRRVVTILRESEQRLRDVLDASPFPTALVDLKDDLILYWSRSAQQKFGHTAATTPEWYRLAYPDPSYRAEVIERWKPFLELARTSDRPVNTGEYQVTCADGRVLTCELYAMFLSSNLVVTLADVTPRKQMEAERQRLQAELLQAQKMESVGRLAGGVAHDFNNMLGVILGQTELAMDALPPSEPVHAELKTIRKAAERSADLTRQLLAFARKQTIAPKVLDLNEAVDGTLKMVRRLIGEDIHLAWMPGQILGLVRVDPSQVDQILANLCINARDAIAGTGQITIKTGSAFLDQNYCASRAGIKPGEYVFLSVSDNGCGMDSEAMSHLFEPFFTTKEVGKGTGLGLATVFGIVTQNNGFIDVDSRPGEGSTFKVYLPKHSSASPPQAATTVPGQVPGRETILLVEDEADMRQITGRMLRRLGYTVVEATNPGEAIRLAREHAGSIDLLLTDVVMPEMNGRDLAKNLLSIYPGIKRLFMSGYTSNVIADHGVLDEGMHFLQKPFSMELLASKLRAVLQQG
jgi:PAS domain S-box-containing protein